MPWLGFLLAILLGTSIARMLTGAGLAIVTFAGLTPLVLGALNAAASSFNNLAAPLAQVMLISGFGVAFSSIGSAIMVRVAIKSAAAGIKKAG